MTDQPKPSTLNDLLRTAALRNRLRVDGSATTGDVSAALHEIRAGRDADQPGSRRLVRSDQVTVSDLWRQLRSAPDGDEEA